MLSILLYLILINAKLYTFRAGTAFIGAISVLGLLHFSQYMIHSCADQKHLYLLSHMLTSVYNLNIDHHSGFMYQLGVYH